MRCLFFLFLIPELSERGDGMGVFTRREIEALVDGIIRHCMETGDPPVGYVVEKCTGMTEETIKNEADRADARGIWERLGRFRTYFWLRRAIDDPRGATFAMFNLRQMENGGDQDKAPASGPGEIVIRMDGVGGDAFE